VRVCSLSDALSANIGSGRWIVSWNFSFCLPRLPTATTTTPMMLLPLLMMAVCNYLVLIINCSSMWRGVAVAAARRRLAFASEAELRCPSNVAARRRQAGTDSHRRPAATGVDLSRCLFRVALMAVVGRTKRSPLAGDEFSLIPMSQQYAIKIKMLVCAERTPACG
jgi:hypothetical protein